MNDNQRKTSIFLAILGSILLIVCSGLYSFTKWRKSELSNQDIIATISITAISILVLVLSLVACCKGWHKVHAQKKIHRKTSYIPVTILMGSNCGICIEQKDSNREKVVRLTCEHTFHKNCVNRSLDTQLKCPICRQTPSNFSSVERVLYRMYGTVSKKIQSMKTREINDSIKNESTSV
ncbi:RING finger protein 122-like isoform X1 [Mytilus californianus]|uniref:RING finger protein 122-like isoform X1 n=1 Tax=Mytilus californianus TaxID=6549 RepID=UPI002247FD2A|nr:RING finger protein 122-like isoform X1 [Mytilus californianus]